MAQQWVPFGVKSLMEDYYWVDHIRSVFFPGRNEAVKDRCGGKSEGRRYAWLIQN